MPNKIGKAITYGLLIWIVGFVWGSIVFIIPALKDLPSIPYVSKYPAISFPLLIAFWFLASFYAKSYLADSQNRKQEGFRFGLTLAVVNFILDLLVLVLLFKTGTSYFASVSVWLSYAILFYVPIRAGKSVS